MRILIATDFYPPFLGGTELYFQNLAQELAARGHQVTVVTVWHAGLPQHETRAGVHIIRLKPLLTRAPWFFSSPRRFHPPFPDPALVSSLKSIIAQQQIDLVHAVGWTAYSCSAAVQGIPDPPPLVVSINDYGYTCPLRTLMNRGRVCSGSHFSKCLTCARAVYGLPKALAACLGIASSKKLLLKNTTSFISLSRCVERLFRRDAFSGCHLQQPPEIVTIPPVALPSQPPGLSSSDGIAQALQNLPSEPYILFVGALQPHKGIFTLLQAYSLLPSPPPLVLIGTTWPDSPQEFPPSVRVIRNAPHPAVMAAWRRCLFGVAPSLWLEPFGGVVLEAMSCARPVIGTQDSGHADMIIDGKTGYLVPPGDPRLLAEEMKNLIASPELYSTMGQAACQAAERFRAEQIMPQYELLYNRCIARSG